MTPSSPRVPPRPITRLTGSGSKAPRAPRTTVQVLHGAALAALLFLFLWITLRIDLVLFAGVLLAIFLRRSAGCFVRATRLPETVALALVVILILAFFAGIGWAFSQSIAARINQLSLQLPAAIETVGKTMNQSNFGGTLLRYASPSELLKPSGNALSNFFGVASNAIEMLASLIIIVFVGFYGAAQAQLYESGFLRLVPQAHRGRAAVILSATAGALWHWMVGRIFSMVVLGVLISLGLWIIRVPLPVALGFLAGVMAFVPYIGTIVAAVPAILIAAAIEPTLAAYVTALYLGAHLAEHVAAHFIESYFSIPSMQRRAVHLPPALTLSAQVMLAFIAGFLGLLLATPLVAAGLILVRMIYAEDILGDILT